MTPSDHNPLLEAINIHKSFSAPYLKKKLLILQGINLTVFPGDTVAIVGRSGEGKSSLLHILGTLDTPSQGTLRICNQDVSSQNREILRKRAIGFLFQSFHLLEDWSVLDNVLMPAKINRECVKKGSPAFEKGMALLEEVGLENRAYFPTKVLSGGEKQRTALARAMCNDPALIYADEPSGNLDQETAALVHELLFQFVRRPGKGLILVTHDLNLSALCTKRYELKKGTLLLLN